MVIRRKGAELADLVVIEKVRLIGKKTNLSVGEGSFIGESAVIALHERVNIGQNVVINAGVKIFTASHDVNDVNWKSVSAPIEIEDYVWIASSAIVLPGTKLSRGCVIGAGAVVSGEIPPCAVVVGNPGRIIKYRTNDEFEYAPARFSATCQAWLGKE